VWSGADAAARPPPRDPLRSRLRRRRRRRRTAPDGGGAAARSPPLAPHPPVLLQRAAPLGGSTHWAHSDASRSFALSESWVRGTRARARLNSRTKAESFPRSRGQHGRTARLVSSSRVGSGGGRRGGRIACCSAAEACAAPPPPPCASRSQQTAARQERTPPRSLTRSKNLHTHAHTHTLSQSKKEKSAGRPGQTTILAGGLGSAWYTGSATDSAAFRNTPCTLAQPLGTWPTTPLSAAATLAPI